MSHAAQRMVAGHLIAVAAGAGLAGLAAVLTAPDFFWAALIGGALLGGALRVGIIVFRQDEAAGE